MRQPFNRIVAKSVVTCRNSYCQCNFHSIERKFVSVYSVLLIRLPNANGVYFRLNISFDIFIVFFFSM